MPRACQSLHHIVEGQALSSVACTFRFFVIRSWQFEQADVLHVHGLSGRAF